MKRINSKQEFAELKEGTPVLFYYGGFQLGQIEFYQEDYEYELSEAEEGEEVDKADFMCMTFCDGDDLCIGYGTGRECTDVIYVLSPQEKKEFKKGLLKITE